MTQGERIREVRKALNLTLEKFGSNIGLKKSSVSQIETGKNSVTEQTIVSICREYNVNYNWLLNGTGNMFNDLPQTVLDDLCKQHDCDDLDRSLIYEYLKLDPEERTVIKNYIKNVFGGMDSSETSEDRIQRELDAYKEELELEARQAEKSSASGTPDAKEA